MSTYDDCIPHDAEELRVALRTATHALLDRGLNVSSKWCAELLSALVRPSETPSAFQTSTPVHEKSKGKLSLVSLAEPSSEDEEDVYLTALSFFRCHELLRAWSSLENCKTPKAVFLRLYSRYLAGEKRRTEYAGELLGEKDKYLPNDYAAEVLQDIVAYEKETPPDGYLLYLKALAQLALQPSHISIAQEQFSTRMKIIDCLVQSVSLSPFNYAAWLKLSACVQSPVELSTILPALPRTVALVFFLCHISAEIQFDTVVLESVLVRMRALFPRSTTVLGMLAVSSYNDKNFSESLAHFETIQSIDPYRLDDVDVLSNMMYVSGRLSDLSMLAHSYLDIDRFRPEVCCLVGNYYSLRREHEKAIIYFRRALKLDRNCLSAWTLMGHEYVEVKNTNAAISCYRRAVESNTKDYRAWYGLGQTYELLGEPNYAVHYYHRATSLRPFDPRMWTALGICYEKMEHYNDAISAYTKTLSFSDPGDMECALHIARLYSTIGNMDSAANYHRLSLIEAEKQGAPTNALGKVYTWLATYEIHKEKMHGDGNLEIAEDYIRQLSELPHQEDKEEADKLLKELEAIVLDRE